VDRPQTTFDAPAVEVVGDTPSHVTFLNVVITGGTVQGPDRGTGAPGLKVAAPGQAIVQACWFFEADPGLLVAHPQADVRVLSGNFISNMVHTRQTAGHLEAYSVAGGFSYGGADIELNAASTKPFVLAGCRAEQSSCFLKVPDTDEPIDVVVKATSMCCEEAILARYGAAGTLVLIGNNADGGVEALDCTGTIWSVGNKLGGSWKAGNPYALGPRARAFVAGDFWETVKPGDPYVSPGNAFLSPDELQARGGEGCPRT